MRKKRAMILIEVMIALFIFAIILTFLFRFFTKMTVVDQKIEKAKVIVFQKQELYIQLNNLFSQVIPTPYFSSDTTISSFYTEEEKDQMLLFFTFQNGVDPDPDFSGPVYGKLFLENHVLKLLLSPLDESNKRREKILGNKIQSFHLAFFQKNQKKINSLSWLSSWDKKKMKIPSMVKIHLSFLDQNKPIEYAFFLPSMDDVVIYSGKSL